MTNQTKPKADTLSKNLLRIAAVLWVMWGLVHVLAGYFTISKETPAAVAGIADAVDPALLAMDYHAAVGAVINQHGFNLLWIGLVATICAVFVWQRKVLAVLLAALVAGLADIGYFLFMDLGGHVHFVPGTVMTIICASAILLSFTALLRIKKTNRESFNA